MTADPNNPSIEDEDLDTTAPDPLDDELTTTVPNPREENVWRMPEPVFRSTSGKVPQGYEREAASFISAAPDPAVATPVTPQGNSSTPVAEPARSAAKVVLVLLGLGAMITFLVVFLTFVYFFFLQSSD